MFRVVKNISEIDIHPPAGVAFGQVDYAPGGTFGPRSQPDIQLVMIDRGSLRVTVGGSEQTVRPGEVACHWPGDMQYYRFDPRKTTTHRWVALTFDPSAEAARWIDERRRGAPRQRRESRAMRRLFSSAMRLGRDESAETAAVRTHLALAYLEAYLAMDGAGRTRSGERLPPALRVMQAMIADRYVEPLTLTDLAAAASVTTHHLVRLSRKHLGTTPMRLLWERRVDRGVSLVRSTGLTISEIAYRVGFANPYHFSRLCKNKHGVSPRKMREQAWGVS